MTRPAEQGGLETVVLDVWIRRAPSLAGLSTLLAGHPAAFRLAGGDDFLDIACDEPVRGRANRAHLRMTAHDGKLMVVFYRASPAADGGTYGYGGLAARIDRLRVDQMRAWLDYLASGFAEDSAPRGMQTSFQYPVPAGEVTA